MGEFRMKCKLASICCILVLFLVAGCAKIEFEYQIPSELIENKAQFNGQVVTIKSKISLDNYRRCTLEMCTTEDPCCNSCSGSLIVQSGEDSIRINSNDISCSGNNCDMVCEPLEVDKTYILTGKFKEANSRYSIDLINFTDE